MIPLYETKWKYLLERQKRKTGMIYCPIFYEEKEIYRPPDALHHTLVHDTQINENRYPLLLNSLLNLTPVFNAMHMWRGSWGKISEYNADKIEDFLKRHPQANEFVNFLRPIRYFHGERPPGGVADACLESRDSPEDDRSRSM